MNGAPHKDGGTDGCPKYNADGEVHKYMSPVLHVDPTDTRKCIGWTHTVLPRVRQENRAVRNGTHEYTDTVDSSFVVVGEKGTQHSYNWVNSNAKIPTFRSNKSHLD